MDDEKVVLDDLDPVEGSNPNENDTGEQIPAEDEKTPSGGSGEATDPIEPELIDPEIPEPLPDEPEKPTQTEDTERDKAIKALKINLRESDCPFFDDEELEYYLEANGGDIKLATYTCLILKSMDTTLTLSGLSCADTSKYFLRLATRYAPNNTGVIEGF